MSKRAFATTVVATVLSLASMASCAHDHGAHNDKHGQAKKHANIHKYRPFKVALWGDEFYNKNPDNKAEDITQTVSSFNEHDIDFTIFVGDSKNGSSVCSDEAIGDDIVTIFNNIDAPTIYTPGDNEWTDCHRTNNGSYDPVERLSFLRDTFFSTDYSQGLNALKLQRQAGLPENSRYEKNKVTFVALHVIGSNNNLVVTESQCTKGSTRTAEDCAAATAEYEYRNPLNVAWLKDSFAEAKANGNVGIVVAIQADPYRVNVGEDYDVFLASLTEDNGFTDFFNTLVEETQNFAGQVVLVHGDSHYFRIDKAMFNDDGSITKNFTRAEVFGSKENDWVEMTVNPASDNVFTFRPVILAD